MLANTTSERFNDFELDDALDQTIHVAVEHASEFANLLILRICVGWFACNIL